MASSPIENLRRKKARLYLGGGKQRIAKQHAQGKPCAAWHTGSHPVEKSGEAFANCGFGAFNQSGSVLHRFKFVNEA